jgi:hypothetical protein
MIDVVYSIPVHEDPDSYYDMIQNIFYFNKTLNILIIVHCNEFMYEILSKKKIHAVILNPIRYNKIYLTYDILQSHIDNYMYFFDNNIKLRYFVIYASNAMFYKNVTLEFIEKEIICMEEYIPQNYYIDYRLNAEENSKPFKENKKIIDIFIKNGINEIYDSQLDGAIIESYIFKECIDFLSNNNIRLFIEREWAFEEYLIPTLYVNIKKQLLKTSICKIFWELKCYTPTIEDIKNTYQPAVKRVERKYNNPIRVWLREMTNSYEGINI